MQSKMRRTRGDSAWSGRFHPRFQLVVPRREGGFPAGHFHAATFSYRALHGEEVNLEQMVISLFEAETLQGILHLLTDNRDLQGAGESEFVRGSMWVGPIERSLAIG